MSRQQLQELLRRLQASPATVDAPIDEQRQDVERLALLPIPAGVECQPVDAEGVRAEWVTAAGADPGRAVIYLHGGAYVLGSIDTHRGVAARISRASLARVLLIGYRLAPEHPFPAALDDSLAAYRWMLATGLDPVRSALAGDSAGGGLAIATLVALREARLPLPAAAVCLSPWVDLEATGESMTTRAAVDPFISRDWLMAMAGLYLAGRDPRTPLASPLNADLSGLPPLLIQVGTAETLLDDANRLAERARAAGVTVQLESWEHMTHGWHAFAGMLNEGQLAIDRVGEFVSAKTGAAQEGELA